jgi:hypothetical protein
VVTDGETVYFSAEVEVKLPDGTQQTLRGEEQLKCSYLPSESSLPL